MTNPPTQHIDGEVLARLKNNFDTEILKYQQGDPLVVFIAQELTHERQTVAEDICKITDDIELSYRNTTLEEWKAFKHIRNAIRDKYVLAHQKKKQ